MTNAPTRATSCAAPTVHSAAPQPQTAPREEASGCIEGAPQKKARAASAHSAPPTSTATAASVAAMGVCHVGESQSLRGVALASGWTSVAQSLLVYRHRTHIAGQCTWARPKVAAFDFDNCVARTSVADAKADSWAMMFPSVPSTIQASHPVGSNLRCVPQISAHTHSGTRLRLVGRQLGVAGTPWFRLQRLHREGHAIAIVSNESLDRFKSVDVLARHLLKKQTRVSQWCQAIGVPVLALVATAKDRFRKPDVGTWHFMTQLAAESKVAIDLSSSFFVGDAAGRTGDHSDSDRAYAKACALRFYNETEFFGPR